MSKRVLLAEQNDTIRGVAETVLRQNGFDIISVSSSEKLFEVLELSAPNLILVDASMVDQDGQPTYQKIRSHASASSVPLALLADEYNESLGLPASAVILRPFDPANLLSQVNQVISNSVMVRNPADPLAGASLDDEFLDSALGLDQIEVTASEDMNKTSHIRRVQPASEDTKIVGVGQFENKPAPVANDSSKVESLMIGEDDSDINHAQRAKPPEGANLNETSGLQLADDQYGLNDPSAFAMDDEGGDHDYNWFVNSMKTESDGSAGGFGDSPTPSKSGDNLEFTDTAGLLDPVTPGPASQAPPSTPQAAADQSSGGMDKFIDEFRQEVEKLGDDGPESIVIPKDEASSVHFNQTEDSDVAVHSLQGPDQASWEDRIENVTPEHLRIFTRELASRMADKIAGMILARIDQDKLLRLIKDELIEELHKKS